MKLATMEDFDEVWSILMQYKNIFPHLRYDYMTRKVTSNETVFDQGVVITFTKYKKKTKLGNISAFGGDYIIHQIAVKNQGDGSAKKIILEFLNWIDSSKCWLAVRASNERAIQFYKKLGFKEMSNIIWSKHEDAPSILEDTLIGVEPENSIDEEKEELPGKVFLYVRENETFLRK